MAFAGVRVSLPARITSMIAREASEAAVDLPPDLDVVAVEDRSSRKLPAPISITELRRVEEPTEEWLVVGLLLACANILLAAYPKSYKTMLLLDLAVALASGTYVLGRYDVPGRRCASTTRRWSSLVTTRRSWSSTCWQ